MSNCILIDGQVLADVYQEQTVRARKEHECCECGDAIALGDLHEHTRGLWEGVWQSYRTCARCVNIREDYFQGWTFTQMREDFREAFGFDYCDGIPDDFAPCGEPPDA